MRRSRLALGLLAAALATGACDGGPEGPGTLVASLRGEDLGAVLVEVTGRGVQGFDGLGDTQIYEAPVPSVPNAFRVILIDPDGVDLRFGIRVEDVGSRPVITVVSAAGVDDRPRLTGDIEARIEG